MNEKDAKLSAIFGDILSKKNEERIPAFQKIKKKVQKYRGIENNKVYQAIMEDRPVAYFSITKKLTPSFETNLKNKEIPFLLIKQPRRSIFLIEKENVPMAKNAIGEIQIDGGIAPKALSYDEIVEYGIEKNEKILFVKNIDEQTMELLRREFVHDQMNKTYSFFQMNDNAWGFALPAKYLLSGVMTKEGNVSFLENLLYISMILAGSHVEQHQYLFQDNVAADRLLAAGCMPSLIHNNQVYIFNPEEPRYILKITKDQFQCVLSSFEFGTAYLSEGSSLEYSSAVGHYILNHELAYMKHKRIAYQKSDVLKAVRQWHTREIDYAQWEQSFQNEQLLARFIVQQFVKKNRQKEWLSDPVMVYEQLQFFTEEFVLLDHAYEQRQCPDGYSGQDAEILYSLFQKADISPEVFHRIREQFGKLEMDNINEMTHRNSLRNKLAGMPDPRGAQQVYR